MSNIFNSANWSKYPPGTFVAGDYFAFKRDDLTAEFPLSLYAVKFHASQFGTGTGTTSANQISLDAVEEIGIPNYRWINGDLVLEYWKYQWSLIVTDSSDAQKRQF